MDDKIIDEIIIAMNKLNNPIDYVLMFYNHDLYENFINCLTNKISKYHDVTYSFTPNKFQGVNFYFSPYRMPDDDDYVFLKKPIWGEIKEEKPDPILERLDKIINLLDSIDMRLSVGIGTYSRY